MAFDTYMDISTIPGESQAKGFEKKIEIYSFSFGASNPTTMGQGSAGLGAGKVSLSSFNFMKKSDIASPKMFKACCTGEHIPTVKVSLRKATGAGGQDVFLTYTFAECLIESVQWSGSSGGDDTPSESASIAFSKVTIEYKTQGADGKLVAGTPVVWDLKKLQAA